MSRLVSQSLQACLSSPIVVSRLNFVKPLDLTCCNFLNMYCTTMFAFFRSYKREEGASAACKHSS
jgi:hypothetical protein